MKTAPRVALVHDWLTGMRGGEKVLEAFCRRFPTAPVYTLVHVPGSVSPAIESHPIHTSFVQSLPGAKRRYQRYLPLFPTAIERFDLRGYDLVLSTSHCVAKGALVHPGTCHLSYCHTPMRYVWSAYEEYFGKGRVGAPASWVLPAIASYLRTWDVAANVRVDDFAANSETVRQRIRRYYGREARVIHPWVDLEFFTVDATVDREDYYLVVSALVPYKRIDLVLETARRVGARFVIVGEGVQRRALEARAPSNVEFVGWVGDEALRAHYRRCGALLFPGVEDFGIVPVEAQACGAPVVGLGQGGLCETVRDRRGGVLYRTATVEAMVDALRLFETLRAEGLWRPQVIRDEVARFGIERFELEVDRWIESIGRPGDSAGAGSPASSAAREPAALSRVT